MYRQGSDVQATPMRRGSVLKENSALGKQMSRQSGRKVRERRPFGAIDSNATPKTSQRTRNKSTRVSKPPVMDVEMMSYLGQEESVLEVDEISLPFQSRQKATIQKSIVALGLLEEEIDMMEEDEEEQSYDALSIEPISYDLAF